MKKLIQFFGVIFLITTLLSFLGAVHPLFDSIAIFRPLIWMGAAICSFAFSNTTLMLQRFLLVITAFPFLIMFELTHNIENPSLRIYQHNLLYTNEAPDLKMVTERLNPDILTLQEIKSAKPTIQALQNYPHQHLCNFAAVGDVGIISKHPFSAQGCSDDTMRGFAWARINDQGKEVTIVSFHLHWPYPFGQKEQLDEILPKIAALPKPIILAGDMNHVLWSHTRKRIENAAGTQALPGLRFTLVRPPLFLPIDQAFGDGVHDITRLERYGSDHNALLIDFLNWPKPANQASPEQK